MRRLPALLCSMRLSTPASSGRRCTNQWMRWLNSDSLRRTWGSKVSTAYTGQPDQRAHLQQQARVEREAQDIVKELVLLVPQRDMLFTDVLHRRGDVHEVIDILQEDILVGGVLFGELERHTDHVDTEHRHPARAVALLEVSACWQLRTTVKDADVVQSEKPTPEQVVALLVFAIDPPGEVQGQLLEHMLQETAVALAPLLGLYFVDLHGGPGQHRRVDVAESPLVGRELAIGVLEPLAAHQQQLLFGEIEVDQCQCDTMKRQVPGGKPWIFPLIRHRDHMVRAHMIPLAVATPATADRRWWLGVVATEQLGHVVVEDLLGLEHAGEGLALHQPLVVVERGRLDGSIACIGLSDARGKKLVERVESSHPIPIPGRKTQAHRGDGIRWNAELVMHSHFGASSLRVDGTSCTAHNGIVDAIFDERRRIGNVEETPDIRLIVGEEQGRGTTTMLTRTLTCQRVTSNAGVLGNDHARFAFVSGSGAERGFDKPRSFLALPAPIITEPKSWQQVQLCGIRPAIDRADADQYIVWGCLGILDEHIEVAVLGEDPSVDQLVLWLVLAAPLVGVDEIIIGIGCLRVLVEHLHVGVGWDRVKVEVVLLDVLAMIALWTIQTEQPLFEDRVVFVPKRQRKTEHLLVVADTGQTILVPTVGARAGMIVREVLPGVAIFAVVFAHRPPAALAELRPPAIPWLAPLMRLAQPVLFFICVTMYSSRLSLFNPI